MFFLFFYCDGDPQDLTVLTHAFPTRRSSVLLPRVGKAPAQDGDGKDRGNILFFGHFADMEEAAFIAAVKARLRTEEAIYETILRDTWQNGVVLARRNYSYLAFAYRLFVVGMTLTFLAFRSEERRVGRGGVR